MLARRGRAGSRRFSPWREELRRAWRELRGPRSTPWRAALSVALGLFIGSIPAFGLHTPVVVALCIWFQLDGALAWFASNVSNPLFAPALLAAEVQLGAWLRTGAPLRLDREAAHALGLTRFVGDLFLGAPLAGLVLAIGGGLVAYAAVALGPRRGARAPYRLPDDAPPWIRAVERVAARYASPVSPLPGERTRFHYLRSKLTLDPVAKLVAAEAGDRPHALGELLDLGAGRGQIALLLVELGCASRVRGVDWDARKVEAARHAAAGAAREGDGGCGPIDAAFVHADVRRVAFEPADTVLLIDLLHYFALDEQDALLDRAAAAVRPGGRIIVREADTERGVRSAITLAEERVFTWARFNRGDRVLFRPAREIVARLEAAGLTCAVRPAWGATPFSNVAIVGVRPAAPRG